MTNEEAIKILKSKMDGSVDTSYEWAETVRMAIKALKQPEPHWIPCSKKLPEEKDGRVLVTMPDGEVTMAIHTEYGDIWFIGDFCGVGRKPIAWTPLPHRYERTNENE